MSETVPAVLTPVLILFIFTFLVYRLRFFSQPELSGRYPFLSGSLLVLFVGIWQSIKASPDYANWFIPDAYPLIELGQFGLLALGVLLVVIGLALFADSWQSRREEIELREGKLAILENLQLSARKPYHLLELLTISLDHILSRFPDTAGAIFLLNRRQRQLVLTASSDLSREETALFEHYPFGRNALSQAVEMGEPMLTSRFDLVDRDGNFVKTRFASTLILPLTSGMEQIGGLLLLSPEKEFFDRTDIKCLLPVAQWLSEKVKSARIARQLTQANSELERRADQYTQATGRFDSAIRAIPSPDAIGEFCKSLVGLVGCESAHLCRARSEQLIIVGGSEPLFDLSENYRTALVDAIDRPRPLVINQEATDESGRNFVVLSTLLVPLGGGREREALVMRKENVAFAVDDGELLQIESLARLASLLLVADEQASLSLTRRKGFNTVIKLLEQNGKPESFERAPANFLRAIGDILPQGATALIFSVENSGHLRLADLIGGPAESDRGPIEIQPGEGPIGKAAVSGEPRFVVSRTEVSRQIDRFDPGNRTALRKLLGEQGLPSFLGCLPILTNSKVVGVAVVAIPDPPPGEQGEWERLLTLAAGLYSLRLTLATPGPSAGTQSELGISHLVNRLNNHFSAVIGTAELAAEDHTTPSPIRERLLSIIDETEQAVSLVRNRSDAGASARSEESPDQIIKSVLAERHVSGDLYMLGNRPREVHLRLESPDAFAVGRLQLGQLLHGVLDRFGSVAEDDDILTLATYVDDDYLYLDLSRHRRNFPPVEAVAEFGRYQSVEQAIADRPSDLFLSSLANTRSFYAVDQATALPGYLSFKLPLSRRRAAASTESAIGSAVIRMLAVDDQQVILDLIFAMGQSLGYEVVTANSGEEGLALAERERFDLVLTDLAMPTMSGIDLARRLKSKSADLPVILVTGWEAHLDAEQIAAAGITDVLYKPFRIEQLTEIVQKTVSGLHRS